MYLDKNIHQCKDNNDVNVNVIFSYSNSIMPSFDLAWAPTGPQVGVEPQATQVTPLDFRPKTTSEWLPKGCRATRPHLSTAVRERPVRWDKGGQPLNNSSRAATLDTRGQARQAGTKCSSSTADR